VSGVTENGPMDFSILFYFFKYFLFIFTFVYVDIIGFRSVGLFDLLHVAFDH